MIVRPDPRQVFVHFEELILEDVGDQGGVRPGGSEELRGEMVPGGRGGEVKVAGVDGGYAVVDDLFEVAGEWVCGAGVGLLGWCSLGAVHSRIRL